MLWITVDKMTFIFQKWKCSLSFSKWNKENQYFREGINVHFVYDWIKSSLYILGDPRRPYPTDLEMRSGLLGQMNNPSTNGVNGHLPGDALAAGRLPGNVH